MDKSGYENNLLKKKLSSARPTNGVRINHTYKGVVLSLNSKFYISRLKPRINFLIMI